MVQEVINIGVGSAGVNIVDSIYSQLALEHGVDNEGKRIKDFSLDGYLNNFFTETYDKIGARCILVGNNSCNLDKIINGPNKKIYNKNNIIQSKEPCCFYSRGYYNVGISMIDETCDIIRKEAEKCDNLEGFHMHGSMVGGMSGFHTLIADRLSVDFCKKSKLSFNEWPSPNDSNIVIDSLNATLGIGDMLQKSGYNIFWHNEKLHQLFYNKFGVYSCNYDNINYLLA